MGMAADDVSAANARRAAGQEQMMSGINQAVGAVAGVATGKFGKGAQGKLAGLFGGGAKSGGAPPMLDQDGDGIPDTIDAQTFIGPMPQS